MKRCPELEALFDPYWRRKGKICGYEGTLGPAPEDPRDPMRCPYLEGSCPAGAGQVKLCHRGDTAIAGGDNLTGRMKFDVGKDMFMEAHKDWRGGVKPRSKQEFKEAITAAWLMWQTGKAAKRMYGPVPEMVTFTLLHWLVMATLWGQTMSLDELLEIDIFDDDYTAALERSDWGKAKFL